MGNWDHSDKASLLSQLPVFNGSKSMKTYKQFIEDIQESSLSRIQSKSQKKGVAAISADRGNLSRKENQARSQQLQKIFVVNLVEVLLK